MLRGEDMPFIYIVSILSLYTLNYNKPQTVEISPVVEVVETQAPAKPAKPKPQQVNTPVEESETSGEENIQEIQNSEENEEDFSDPELYEEISFEDNFDKEYRNDVGDSYFEYPEDEEINIPEENEEE